MSDAWTKPSRINPPTSLGAETPDHYCITSAAYLEKVRPQYKENLPPARKAKVIGDLMAMSAAAKVVDRDWKTLKLWVNLGRLKTTKGDRCILVSLSDVHAADALWPRKTG